MSEVENILLNYGPLGVVSLVLGWFAWFMFRRLIKEVDELRAERTVFVKTLTEIVPLMERSTAIHEKRQAADEKLERALEEMNSFILDLRAELGMRR